jgi:hypothetical protein
MQKTHLASWLLIISGSAIAMSAITSPALFADIKTQEKTSFQMGGVMGGLINRFAGDAAKDGVVSSVAVHGTRKMTSNDATGRIVDLGEERVYDIDYKHKEYKVTTFAELRKQWLDAQEKAKKDVSEMKKEDKADVEQQGKQYEISFDVKQTGQTKSIAGHNTREAILTITVHEKGKAVEDGGGLVMTNDMWIAPRISEMDEIAAFDIKFAKAIYGDVMPNIDAAQMSMLLASYPAFTEMTSKMATEAKKLEGTPLAVTMTLEAVKSAEQMKAASASAGASASPVGGLAGRLAARIGPKPKPGEQKTKAFSSSNETISISTSVTDSDTAVPAGFKEKK